MWLWKDLMSKRARLSVSVLLCLERVVTEVILDWALAVWTRGCYVSNRNGCVTLRAGSPRALGWRRKALCEIFMEALINLVVTRLLPFVRVRGMCEGGPWVPCWVPRHRLGASQALGRRPAALRCPRPPPAAASSCPWAVAWLQQMFLRFWLKSIFLVCEYSLSDSFSYFHVFAKKFNVCFFKGFKIPTPFFFFPQHLSGRTKNVSYPAAVLTELKLESSLSYPGKNIISNIFLFSNPYVAQ